MVSNLFGSLLRLLCLLPSFTHDRQATMSLRAWSPRRTAEGTPVTRAGAHCPVHTSQFTSPFRKGSVHPGTWNGLLEVGHARHRASCASTASPNAPSPSHTRCGLYWDAHIATWGCSDAEYSPPLELLVVKRPLQPACLCPGGHPERKTAVEHTQHKPQLRKKYSHFCLGLG